MNNKSINKALNSDQMGFDLEAHIAKVIKMYPLFEKINSDYFFKNKELSTYSVDFHWYNPDNILVNVNDAQIGVGSTFLLLSHKEMMGNLDIHTHTLSDATCYELYMNDITITCTSFGFTYDREAIMRRQTIAKIIDDVH